MAYSIPVIDLEAATGADARGDLLDLGPGATVCRSSISMVD